MSQQLIKFKQQRELGEILSITFKFVRENYRSAGKIFIKLVGPVFILLVAAVAYYSWSSLGASLFAPLEGSNFIISLMILLLAYLLYVSTMMGTIFHIIDSYINNNGKIDYNEVKDGMKSDFGKILVLTFISWILILAGFMLFILPGIYLAVPLSLATAIMVFRKQGIIGSISESFELVKENWWMTFATVLCIGLVVYMIGFVFQLPAIFYVLIKTILFASEGSAAHSGEIFGTGYIIVSTASSIIQYLVYSVMPIGIAFVYFNLNEKKHFSGTYETIQQLGNKE